MAMTFHFLPGERLNEAILAKELGVSRTPLREALNRLSSEGFLTFSANNGFFRKTIDVKEIFDLYEFRRCLELAAVKLSVERATDEQLSEIEAFVAESALEVKDRTVDDFVTLDERFHEMLIKLTGNMQMLDALKKINARIQFVRWLDMTERRPETQSQHKLIVAALRKRGSRGDGTADLGAHCASAGSDCGEGGTELWANLCEEPEIDADAGWGWGFGVGSGATWYGAWPGMRPASALAGCRCVGTRLVSGAPLALSDNLNCVWPHPPGNPIQGFWLRENDASRSEQRQKQQTMARANVAVALKLKPHSPG